jgi:hypothetical protein
MGYTQVWRATSSSKPRFFQPVKKPTLSPKIRNQLCLLPHAGGRDQILRRIRHPEHKFPEVRRKCNPINHALAPMQAFGAVMGMDWHSSGITTSVMGALKRGLKRGLNPRFGDLGLMVCGGRGRHSVRTPEELRSFGVKTGLDGDALARTSRLTARVDNNAVADGFQLYLHSFVITKSGEWAVVQQGMNPKNHLARRYHWHSATVRNFVSDPHSFHGQTPFPNGSKVLKSSSRANHSSILALLKVRSKGICK